MTYTISPRRRAHMAHLSKGMSAEVHIPVDVSVEGDNYLMTAFVPGVNADEVKIEVLEDTISISGEFLPAESEDIRYLLRERPHGRFSRVLRLPSTLDASTAKAEVSNGVLSLQVSKAESAKAKQITVKGK